MSKIICEICGTAYPDTAKECPICGFPHSQTETDLDLDLDLDVLQDQDDQQTAHAVSKKVKGGRFSSKNVKKRHHETYESYDTPEAGDREAEDPADSDNRGRKPQKGLKIAIAVLAVLVILVGAYIAYRFVSGAGAYGNADESSQPTGQETSDPALTETDASQTQAAVTPVACEDIIVSNDTVELRGAGRGWMLDVAVFPENTTDTVTFTSSDETVVEVSENGRITAVGPGSAVITITCGNITRECVVNCNFDGVEASETATPSETTEATEESQATEAATQPVQNDEFRLDLNDVSLFSVGESFTFSVTSGGQGLSRSEVDWHSTDPDVATVKNGTVTAVSNGLTTITATYDGKVQKCIVRCRMEPAEAKPDSPYSDSNWKLSDADADATLVIGESFSLRLTNGAGETANVSWSSSNAGVVSIDGNSVTGQIPGITHVTASVDGQSFSCIVRVIEGRE